ncbi:MAG: SPOR domain-containing protein [Betaproteobacteria bacterium]|nr:SPOR domain-containing protein [Betaproteobacteria bacterium]
MKALLILLLVANVAFFVFGRYGSELAGGDSNLISQQLNPEAIRLLTAEQVASVGTSKRNGSKTVACLEWGAFASGEISRAESALATLAPGIALAQRRVEEKAGYWVYLPPQGSRQAANQKLDELKRFGVEDYFVIQDDPKFRFAISLGVFKTEEAAKSRLEELRARGVRTAQVGARELSTQKTYIQLRNVPEALAAKLNDIRPAFAGTELKQCSIENKNE